MIEKKLFQKDVLDVEKRYWEKTQGRDGTVLFSGRRYLYVLIGMT